MKCAYLALFYNGKVLVTFSFDWPMIPGQTILHGIMVPNQLHAALLFAYFPVWIAKFVQFCLILWKIQII